MTWLPKSRTARRRLMIAALVAPVLALAVGLSLYAARSAVSLFLIPSQALKEEHIAGRTVQLGGYVQKGSLVRHPDQEVEFTVADNAQPGAAAIKVKYSEQKYGPLPDLFREGQGVVTKGVYHSPSDFQATQVLAKHDERYMPREVTEQLKKNGEWQRDGEGGSDSQRYQ